MKMVYEILYIWHKNQRKIRNIIQFSIDIQQLFFNNESFLYQYLYFLSSVVLCPFISYRQLMEEEGIW